MRKAIRVCCSLRNWWDSCARGTFLAATRNHHAKRGWSPALIPPATRATCVANESTLCILVGGASNSLESWIPCIWHDKLWKLLHLHGLRGIRNILSLLFYNLHCIYTLWFHLSWRSQLRNESSETGSLWSWVMIQLCSNFVKEWLEKLRAEFFEGKTQWLKERRDENCVLDAVKVVVKVEETGYESPQTSKMKTTVLQIILEAPWLCKCNPLFFVHKL